MAFGPGEWVELVRDVPGATRGRRGKVTSTGFLGGLDITLENGATVTGVDASAVVASGPSTASAIGPGDWVELVRDVRGAVRGQRGRVTSTGFLGGLDLELETGARVRGVDRAAVVPSGPSAVGAASNSGRGGRLLSLVVTLVAVALIVVAFVWIRWGT